MADVEGVKSCPSMIERYHRNCFRPYFTLSKLTDQGVGAKSSGGEGLFNKSIPARDWVELVSPASRSSSAL